MSLKGIELQIAIPKTVDAGKVSEQKQQQSQLNQDQANVLMERQTLKRRETVLETEELSKIKHEKKERDDGQNNNKDQAENEEKKKTVHPFKGAFVDYTG